MTSDLHPRQELRTLHTERLTIRPATEADVEVTFAYRRLHTVAQWITELADDRETYRASFTRAAEMGTTLIVERDRVVVGDLTLRLENSWAQAEVSAAAFGKQAELGWRLDPAHSGHGYATEAVAELIRYSFDDLELHRLVAICFAENESSWRLMERLGMRRETHAIRESLHRSGEWKDSLTYALLADEYRSSTQPASSAASSERIASTPQ